MLVAGRATVCVSTQIGCAVGCAFCASGRLGLRRDLTAEEIVDQVLHFARLLRDDGGRRVTNVVFMGMGEPFHTYDETLRACRLLNDPDGFGLAARHISVSTVGVVPGIDRFAAEPLQLNLAVSLHAATDDLRDRLVPLNRTYPLDEVFAACARYVEATRRKLLFEYVVLRGVNDTPAQVTRAGAAPAPPALPPQSDRLQRDRRRVLAAGGRRDRGDARPPGADRRERHGAPFSRRGHRGRLRPARAAPPERLTSPRRNGTRPGRRRDRRRFRPAAGPPGTPPPRPPAPWSRARCRCRARTRRGSPCAGRAPGASGTSRAARPAPCAARS